MRSIWGPRTQLCFHTRPMVPGLQRTQERLAGRCCFQPFPTSFPALPERRAAVSLVSTAFLRSFEFSKEAPKLLPEQGPGSLILLGILRPRVTADTQVSPQSFIFFQVARIQGPREDLASGCPLRSEIVEPGRGRGMRLALLRCYLRHVSKPKAGAC